MLKLAIFISGRIMNYKQCLLPIIQHLKNQGIYDIKLFLSINSEYRQDVLDTFSDVIGLYQLSCFYNDLNNFQLIEKYEKENNMNFDIICKMRSDVVFDNMNDIIFHKNKEEELILNNINLHCPISAYGITPPFLSDAFCFGNKKSMKIYCDTYNTIKRRDIEYKGLYNRTFEPYLNEHIYMIF